jgi:hypothetical protein
VARAEVDKHCHIFRPRRHTSLNVACSSASSKTACLVQAMERTMTKKTLVFGGLVAAAMVAGGIAAAQPFGPGRGHGGGRHGMHVSAEQGAARGSNDGGGRGSGQRMGHSSDHAQGERRGPGPGMGMGRGMMGMGAAGPDAATAGEIGDIHMLFAEHAGIRRSVTNLPNGIRTVTESDDPRLADVIRTHVAEMGLSWPRFLWTPICPKRDRNDGVQHDEDRRERSR